MIPTATDPQHHHRHVDPCYHLLEKSSDDDDTNEAGEVYQQEQQAKVAPFESEGMVDGDEHSTTIPVDKCSPYQSLRLGWSIPYLLIVILGFLRVAYLIIMPAGRWCMRHRPTMMIHPPPSSVASNVVHPPGIERERQGDVRFVLRDIIDERDVPGPSSASSVRLLSAPVTVIKLRGGSKKTY